MKISKSIIVLLLFALIPNGIFGHDISFPYELKKRDFLLLPLGLGITMLGSYLCENYKSITIGEIKLLNRKDVNAFDRPATYNWSLEYDDRSGQYRDVLVYSSLLLLSVPPLLHASLSETAAVGTMFLESCLFLCGVTYMTKAAVGRKRPYLYNTNLSAEERSFIGGSNASLSFFSGHTAAAFTCAAFVSKVMTDIHGDSIWTKLLWGSSMTLAALTGYARFKAGEHYPTDVIAGAVVGFAIGYFIPALHKKKKNRNISLIISPNRFGICFGF